MDIENRDRKQSHVTPEEISEILGCPVPGSRDRVLRRLMMILLLVVTTLFALDCALGRDLIET